MPPTGSPRRLLPTISRMMPSQKVGSDHVNSPNSSDPISSAVPRRHAASSPSAIPATIASAWPTITSSTVFSSRSRSRSATGRLKL